MRLQCLCGHEEYVDEQNEIIRQQERCPGCGKTNSLKCAHESCFEGYCENCGEPEPNEDVDPMDYEDNE